MNFFEEATLRLKQQLKVIEDREVAGILGLAANTWAMRKKRGSFPEKELRAVAQQRPELGIDVDYVLTGEGMRHVTGRLDSKVPVLTAAAAVTAGMAIVGRYMLQDDGEDCNQVGYALNATELKLLRDYRASSVDVQAVICAAAAAGSAQASQKA